MIGEVYAAQSCCQAVLIEENVHVSAVMLVTKAISCSEIAFTLIDLAQH